MEKIDIYDTIFTFGIVGSVALFLTLSMFIIDDDLVQVIAIVLFMPLSLGYIILSMRVYERMTKPFRVINGSESE